MAITNKLTIVRDELQDLLNSHVIQQRTTYSDTKIPFYGIDINYFGLDPNQHNINRATPEKLVLISLNDIPFEMYEDPQEARAILSVTCFLVLDERTKDNVGILTESINVINLLSEIKDVRLTSSGIRPFPDKDFNIYELNIEIEYKG